MTCIAAWADQHGVWMCSDGLSIGDRDVVSSAKRKISRIKEPKSFTGKAAGDILIGSAGRTILARVRDHVGIATTPDPNNDDDCNKWAHAIADALVEAAFDFKQPPTQNEFGLDGCFLIGWAGRLWYIGGDQYAELVNSHYFAVGSGDMVALGALYALQAEVELGRLHPAKALEQAVVAACVWRTDVGGVLWHEEVRIPA